VFHDRFADRFTRLDETGVQAVVTARLEGAVTNGWLQEITGAHLKDITVVLQALVREGRLQLRYPEVPKPTGSGLQNRGGLRMNTSTLVSKLWNYCNVLRDDGIGYGDCVEQRNYLLFLTMADERSKPPNSQASLVPAQYVCPALRCSLELARTR
jgi:hypothetical protein